MQAICDRVIIINRGRLALDSKLADLRRGGRLRLVTSAAPDIIEPLAETLDLVEGIDPLPPQAGALAYGLRLNGHAAEVVAPKVARAVNDKGLDLIALYPEQRDLEKVFAEITARGEQTEVEHD